MNILQETSPAPRAAEAERLVLRIEAMISAVGDGIVKLSKLIGEAYEKRVDKVLGYDSWGAFAQERFAPKLANYSPEIKAQLALALVANGLSQRPAAAAVGVSQKTVSRIEQTTAQVSQRDSPNNVVQFPVRSTGLDGKTYSKRKPTFNEAREAKQVAPAKIDPKKVIPRSAEMLREIFTTVLDALDLAAQHNGGEAAAQYADLIDHACREYEDAVSERVLRIWPRADRERAADA